MTAWGQMLPLKSLTSLGILCIQKTTGFCRGWICKVCIIVAAWSGLLELAIRITPAQGLLIKPSTYTPFEKKSLTEMIHSSPDICAGLSPALLCSLEWVPWIILGQVFHGKLAELLDPSVFPAALPFPKTCQPRWRNTTVSCDHNCSNRDHWKFPSHHSARWL